MFNGLTGWHLVIILVIVLLLFGAPKLPALARSLGQSMRIFKGDGSVWADADIGNLASSATAKMNTTAIVAGGPIRINAFTIQIG